MMQHTRKGPIYILVAEGFEECDVVVVTRALRQRGYPVALVGLRAGAVRGCYGISVATDRTLSVTEEEQPRAVILPGGIHGTRQLNGDPRVHFLLHSTVQHGGYLVAVETGEMVLRTAGVLHETERESVDHVGGSAESDERAVVDGQLIWSRGAEAAQLCTAALVPLLECGPGAR